MIRRPPRSTLSSSSAASDVYKRQVIHKRQTHLCYSSRDNAGKHTDKTYCRTLIMSRNSTSPADITRRSCLDIVGHVIGKSYDGHTSCEEDFCIDIRQRAPRRTSSPLQHLRRRGLNPIKLARTMSAGWLAELIANASNRLGQCTCWYTGVVISSPAVVVTRDQCHVLMLPCLPTEGWRDGQAELVWVVD